jgi:hypothetical protein
MKVHITRGSYGFGHEWTLEVYGKQYYLGQDVKFCSRVLGVSPSAIVSAIGSPEIEVPAVNKKLAKFICDELGITRKTSINAWDLCAQ